MPVTLNSRTVLTPVGHCTVREQEEQFLIYNNRTDELHLVSPTGCYVYWLCDGVRTLGELQTLLGVPAEFHDEVLDVRLGRFVADLAERQILEVSSDG